MLKIACGESLLKEAKSIRKTFSSTFEIERNIAYFEHLEKTTKEKGIMAAKDEWYSGKEAEFINDYYCSLGRS